MEDAKNLASFPLLLIDYPGLSALSVKILSSSTFLLSLSIHMHEDTMNYPIVRDYRHHMTGRAWNGGSFLTEEERFSSSLLKDSTFTQSWGL